MRAVQRNLQGDQETLETEAAVARAAGLATLVLEGGATMPVSSIVAEVRSAAADLLEAIGVDHATAVTQVRQAAGEVKGDHRPAATPASSG